MTRHYGQLSGDFTSYWGYAAEQCQVWMDQEIASLNARVTAMQNAGSLTGRKRAQAFAAGIEAQKTLDYYNQYNVFWQPQDPQPLTTGGQGYVDGGEVVDVSNFERDNSDNYPTAPLTDDSYSDPKTAPAPLTDDSYSEPKTAPQIVDSYAEDSPVGEKLTEGDAY